MGGEKISGEKIMSMVLNTNDLLDVAADILPDHELVPLATLCEIAADQLARAIARRENVTLHSTAYEQGFGGLCATFNPGPNGETSDAIAAGDEGGEW
jgi:hypothetical protein